MALPCQVAHCGEFSEQRPGGAAVVQNAANDNVTVWVDAAFAADAVGACAPGLCVNAGLAAAAGIQP